MRIGICGVSSTGKTTLTRAVSEATGVSAILDTTIHELCFAHMVERGTTPHTRYFPDMTPQEHVNFERAYLQVRAAEEERLKDFIADETPIDSLNYLYIFCASRPNLMAAAEFELYEKALRQRVLTYDAIWYLPQGALKIENDERRFTHAPFLRYWDHSMRGIIQTFDDKCIPLFEMRTSNLEKRVASVLKSIKVPNIFQAVMQRRAQAKGSL